MCIRDRDPQARHILWDRLFRLKRQGVTLIITTHYMDEAEQLCDRLVVMDKGRIVAQGSPRGLIEEHSTREVLELRFDPDEQAGHLDALADVGERVEVLPDRVLVYTADGDAALTRSKPLGSCWQLPAENSKKLPAKTVTKRFQPTSRVPRNQPKAAPQGLSLIHISEPTRPY